MHYRNLKEYYMKYSIVANSFFKRTQWVRLIHSKPGTLYYLVIHIETLHVFMMKKGNNLDSMANEIHFCKNYSHRCLTKFYGFLHENKKITGFLYEYMPNGTLHSYVTLNKDQIDEIFILMTIIRLFLCLDFLNVNHLIHRDFSPFNILLNHDYLPYLSDFETIRHPNDEYYIKAMTHDIGSFLYASPEQYNEKNISYHTDIYSFGLIIYFLFEKKDMKSNDEFKICLSEKDYRVFLISNVSENVQNLYRSCTKYSKNDRPSIQIIKNKLIYEIDSFIYLEHYLLQKNAKINSFVLNQYFFECINIKYGDTKYMMKFIQYLICFRLLLSIKSTKGYTSVISKLGKLYLDGFGFIERDFSKAKKYFELGKAYNDSKSYFFLGKIYKCGLGVEINTIKAKEFFEISAKKNNSRALFSLGIHYFNENNYSKAKMYFESSSKLNNSHAMYNLGVFYLNGYDVKPNHILAKQYFEQSAKLNNIQSIVALISEFDLDPTVADSYLNSIKYNDLRKSNSDLLLKIGVFYYEGKKVKQNYFKAKKYFELSATLNNYTSLTYLGCLYLNGFGVEKDYFLAKCLIEIAAMKNIDIALFTLGNMYYYGLGTKQDYVKAKEYYELSANSGNDNSLNNLGNLYKKGLGVKQDYVKAKEYYELSAEKGNGLALFNLGNLYQMGFGVQQNYTKAVEYFESSYKLGNINALFNLIFCYSNGYGVCKDLLKAEYYCQILSNKDPKGYYYLGNYYFIKNPSKAQEYYEIGAQLNDIDCQLELGIMYLYGIGIDKNPSNAKKYLEFAAKQNSSIALMHLGFYYLTNPSYPNDYIKAINYFELSTKKNNVISFYILGSLFSNCYYFEKDISKAIFYYTECVKCKEFTEISKSNHYENIDFTSYIDHKNWFYYPAHNDLGLLYLIYYNDIKKADYHIKTAAYGEFAYAQNNFGLLNQFYFNQKENAEYFYKKASKSNFSLAEYNLGYLLEKDGKIEESIEYYTKASEHAEIPLKLYDNTFSDYLLDKSIAMIINFTNMKLFEYHISKSNYKIAKKYFMKIRCENRFFDSYIIKKSIENAHLDKKGISFDDPKILFNFIIENKDFLYEIIKMTRLSIEEIKANLYKPPYQILFGKIDLSNKKHDYDLSKIIKPFIHPINSSFYEGFGI